MKTHIPPTAAVIITYNPPVSFKYNLKKIAEQFSLVVIVDNASSKWTLRSSKKIQIIRLKENQGIAAAQNVGARYAWSKRVKAVVLFDHDSYPEKNFVNALWLTYEIYRTQKHQSPIVGSRIYDRNTKQFNRHPVRNGFIFRRVEAKSSGYLLVMMAIASGTFLTREVWNQVGEMRSDFFIDYVDWEYCLRAHKKGVETIIAPNAILSHARGEREPISILGFKIFPPQYAKSRYATLFRNRIFTLKFYFRDTAFVVFECVAIVRDVLLLFFENERLSKIGVALRAIYRGLTTGTREKLIRASSVKR